MDEMHVNLSNISHIDDIRNKDQRIYFNEVGLDALSHEVMETAKLLNDNMTKILSLVDETAVFYDCESGVNFRNKFYLLSNEFPTIIQNIENYAYSLKNVINKYNENKQVIVNKINDRTDTVKSELLAKGEVK